MQAEELNTQIGLPWATEDTSVRTTGLSCVQMMGLCIFLLTFFLTWFTSIYNNLHKMKQNRDKKIYPYHVLKSNINEGSHPTGLGKNRQPIVIAGKDRPPGIPAACVLSLWHSLPCWAQWLRVLGCTVPAPGEPVGYFLGAA